MRLTTLDWCIIAASIAVTILIGIWAGRRAGRNAGEYFLSGRSLGWGVLGLSIVATTFSTDTPNLVTDLTRQHGVAGNWSWWAFMLTTITTTFFFGSLWRRSGVATDVEFYELRYSGRTAAALRAFRSIYLGVIINVIIMGAVTLALIKFGSVLLGFTPVQSVLLGGGVALVFTAIGGLRGVIVSDCFLFVIAMTGSVAAAVFALKHPAVGGLSGLFGNPVVAPLSHFLPDASKPGEMATFFIVPLLVQWWSVWYPGAEPGGGGFAAQRMFAARDEKNAVGAMLLFSFAHYALRPWPWLIVALASLIVYPDIASLRAAFPEVDPSIIGNDFAYPAMLTLLPAGWLGLIAASLLAAYVSTTATLLNLGSSYMVFDIYVRFVKPDASERQKVLVGRIVTVLLMVTAGFIGLSMASAVQAFNLLLSIGAGTGLLLMVRWFWPRVNAMSEVAAMIIALVVSATVQSGSIPALAAAPDWMRLVMAVGLTTAGWIIVTLVTPPPADATLIAFYQRIHPPGPLWRAKMRSLDIPLSTHPGGIGAASIAAAASCGLVGGSLFLIGSMLRGQIAASLGFGVLAACSGLVLAYAWPRLSFEEPEPEGIA